MKDGAIVNKVKMIPIGAWCNIKFKSDDEYARWYISFGQHHDDLPVDSYGISDEKIGFYSSWAELPLLLDKDLGEDFYIVAIEGINIREVAQ